MEFDFRLWNRHDPKQSDLGCDRLGCRSEYLYLDRDEWRLCGSNLYSNCKRECPISIECGNDSELM